jgi:CBS domain-containing protein
VQPKQYRIISFKPAIEAGFSLKFAHSLDLRYNNRQEPAQIQEGLLMNTVRHLLQIKGKDVWSISPDATVYDALRMMADKNVGALLVMEGDHARKIILEDRSSKGTKVREIMTELVCTIHPDQTVHEVMELMTAKRIRHVPVLDEHENVLGVISIGDIVKDIMYEQRMKIRTLTERITGK